MRSTSANSLLCRNAPLIEMCTVRDNDLLLKPLVVRHLKSIQNEFTLRRVFDVGALDGLADATEGLSWPRGMTYADFVTVFDRKGDKVNRLQPTSG
jgi:hypothetical protein